MKKRTTKNGKDSNRVKGWNGITRFKERASKPVKKIPTDKTDNQPGQPDNELIRENKAKIAEDPYARRAVTEIVKGMTGTRK